MKFTGAQLVPALTSLEELPDNIQEPFYFLCELAYKGMMEDKVVFSSLDMPSKQNLLGLVQGMESLTIGKVISYHFIHLSTLLKMGCYPSTPCLQFD